MSSAVLLHEPEAESREFLERHLRDDGFDVVGATRNREALDLLERTCPDLVLLAESDLCRRLRDGEPGRRWNRNVPVIVLAPPDADRVDRVRALGPTVGIDVTTLCAVLARASVNVRVTS